MPDGRLTRGAAASYALASPSSSWGETRVHDRAGPEKQQRQGGPGRAEDRAVSRLGELLVREKMLSLQQLQQAQDEAKRTGKRLGATLARLGYVRDQDLTQFVAKQYSLPS